MSRSGESDDMAFSGASAGRVQQPVAESQAGVPSDPPPPPSTVSLPWSWSHSGMAPPSLPTSHPPESSASSASSAISSSNTPSPSPFSHYGSHYASSSSSSVATSPSAFNLPQASLDLELDCSVARPSTSPASTTGSTATLLCSSSEGAGGGGGGSSTPVGEEAPSEFGPPASLREPELLPPENFAMVSSFLYRSSFPGPKNFSFLKTLGLKSVLTLVLEDYPQENRDFLEAEGINFFQVGIPGNKSPIVQIPDDKIVEALAIVFDVRNHPMLIHCNKGKHRTGCLVGCIRKAQEWPVEAIAEEYRRYSHPKSRSIDAQYIEAFNRLPEVWDSCVSDNLPSWLSRAEARDLHYACAEPSESIYATYADSSSKKKKKLAEAEAAAAAALAASTEGPSPMDEGETPSVLMVKPATIEEAAES